MSSDYRQRNGIQNLFWDVMKGSYGSDFATVAQQGNKAQEKHYFQVYAPVDPIGKIPKAVAKLKTDFATLKKQWGGSQGAGLLKFSFVFNDKYQGFPKELEQELSRLRKKHPQIEFAQYCCRDLESDFLQLDESDWDRILGGAVPDPDRVASLDFGALRDVIRHIMEADVAESESRLGLPPELEEKIVLNGLSKVNAVRIQSGALLTGRIDKYIGDNSTFALDELREHIVGVYEAAKAAVVAEPLANSSVVDAVFLLFRRGLAPPSATAATMFAVDAVIGYFFEACDVFDPKASKGTSGASP